jgi:hypothetical protein
VDSYDFLFPVSPISASAEREMMEMECGFAVTAPGAVTVHKREG